MNFYNFRGFDFKNSYNTLFNINQINVRGTYVIYNLKNNNNK